MTFARECCLLVLNLVSSTPPRIRQPGPRIESVLLTFENVSLMFPPTVNSQVKRLKLMCC
jgi:hypothetical protein